MTVLQMITIIESVDGQSALLGRPKSLRSGGVLTCLSGFIEQGESIEEAVRREVKEEAGISVGDVTVLGSQPWPIGMYHLQMSTAGAPCVPNILTVPLCNNYLFHLATSKAEVSALDSLSS